jgi:hypothetical protein
MIEHVWTWFKDENDNGKTIGSQPGILPIPLFKGMKITIHGYSGKVFQVVDWDYHHGHEDEEAGLRIYLK